VCLTVLWENFIFTLNFVWAATDVNKQHGKGNLSWIINFTFSTMDYTNINIYIVTDHHIWIIVSHYTVYKWSYLKIFEHERDKYAWMSHNI